MTQQLIDAAKALFAEQDDLTRKLNFANHVLVNTMSLHRLRTAVEAAEKTEQSAQVHAAIKLLKEIRYHKRRHDLDRDWLTKADHVLGTWGPVNTDCVLAQQEAEPLSEERIVNEFNRTCYVPMKFADGTEGIALDQQAAIDFARAIEAAHGIGVKP